jgi:hypothetical protein
MLCSASFYFIRDSIEPIARRLLNVKHNRWRDHKMGTVPTEADTELARRSDVKGSEKSTDRFFFLSERTAPR